MDLSRVTHCKIHPAIGVARVGDSPDGSFIGPEVPGVTPNPRGGFKDRRGRIKRQVARFRLYGYDEQGNVVGELTAADANITWTVHVANTKGDWFEFVSPMDLPDASTVIRRNARMVDDRSLLLIDPGQRSLTGPNGEASFDGGRFIGTNVSLGKMQTDEHGRLLVFGGLGVSNSVDGSGIAHVANNDFWYDDTSDGPVSASVTADGRQLEVESAWIIVAPPDYAPSIAGVVTLYDVVYQAAVDMGERPPADVSFTRDIYPIFERFCRTQWVSQGFNFEFGWGAPDGFLDPDRLVHLASNAPADEPARQAVFERFRPPYPPDSKPTPAEQGPNQIPPIYGDGGNFPPTIREWLTVTPVQYDWLGRWAAGNFTADWHPDAPPGPTSLDRLPLEERPRALDRAALEACLGGPFHPGCEATWSLRMPLLYIPSKPFRVKPLPHGVVRDFGPELTREQALAKDGPLDGSGPGDVTKWLGVPWQADMVACRFAESAGTYPDLPTFWPARSPNQVLTEEGYRQVMDETLSGIQRMRYFNVRRDWLRNLPPDFGTRLNLFPFQWSTVGIVTRQPPPTDAGFPLKLPDMYVETENQQPPQAARPLDPTMPTPAAAEGDLSLPAS